MVRQCYDGSTGGTIAVSYLEELGLPEVPDIPHEHLQDPVWHRTGHSSHITEKAIRIPTKMPNTRSMPG